MNKQLAATRRFASLNAAKHQHSLSARKVANKHHEAGLRGGQVVTDLIIYSSVLSSVGRACAS